MQLRACAAIGPRVPACRLTPRLTPALLPSFPLLQVWVVLLCGYFVPALWVYHADSNARRRRRERRLRRLREGGARADPQALQPTHVQGKLPETAIGAGSPLAWLHPSDPAGHALLQASPRLLLGGCWRLWWSPTLGT